ncbi:MAG: DUF4230 domain-containing protein [Prevotella sp.]
MKQGLNFNKTIVVYVIMAMIMTMACNSDRSAAGSDKPDIDTVGLFVTQIKSCSRLYTAECRVHKIITHDDDIKIKGRLFDNDFELSVPFSERKIAIPMDATFKAYIDLENFSSDNIRRTGNKIEILLPYPQVVMTSSSIDHEGIRRDVRFSRRTFSDEELTQYANQGKQSILENMQHSGIVETAKKGAANVIIPMITQMGYDESNIIITFDDSGIRQIKSVNNENIHE